MFLTDLKHALKLNFCHVFVSFAFNKSFPGSVSNIFQLWVFTETGKEASSKKKDSNKINQFIFQSKKIMILTLIYINHNYTI